MESSPEKNTSSRTKDILSVLHIILILIIGVSFVLSQLIPQKVSAAIFSQWYQLHPVFSFLLNNPWFYSLFLLDISIWLGIKLFYSGKIRFKAVDAISVSMYVILIIITMHDKFLEGKHSGSITLSRENISYEISSALTPNETEKYRNPVDLEWKKYESSNFTALASAKEGSKEYSFLYDVPTKVFNQIFELKQFRESSIPRGILIDIRNGQSKERPLVLQAFLNQIIGTQEFFLPFLLQKFSQEGNPIFVPLNSEKQPVASLAFEITLGTSHLDKQTGLTITPFQKIFDQSVAFYTFPAFPLWGIFTITLLFLIQQFFWWFQKE